MAQRSFEDAENERRQLSLVQFGDVTEVLPGALYRVELDDGLPTPPLPCLRHNSEKDVSYAPLSVGEQVVVMAPNGDFGLGFILGSIPKKATLKDKPLTRPEMAFSDGTSLSYDKETKTLKVKVANEGKVTIEVTGGAVTLICKTAEIQAEETTVTGNLTVKGNVKSEKDIKADGNISTAKNLEITGTSEMKGNIKVSGDLEATGELKGKEVKAGAIALTTHKHAGVQGGSGSTGPATP